MAAHRGGLLSRRPLVGPHVAPVAPAREGRRAVARRASRASATRSSSSASARSPSRPRASSASGASPSTSTTIASTRSCARRSTRSNGRPAQGARRRAPRPRAGRRRRSPARRTRRSLARSPTSRGSTSASRVDDDAEVELERTLRGTLRARILRRLRSTARARNTPRGNLWTGDGWNVSFRPTLQLRVPQPIGLEGTARPGERASSSRLLPAGAPRALGDREPSGAPRAPPAGRDRAAVDFEIVRW